MLPYRTYLANHNLGSVRRGRPLTSSILNTGTGTVPNKSSGTGSGTGGIGTAGDNDNNSEDEVLYILSMGHRIHFILHLAYSQEIKIFRLISKYATPQISTDFRSDFRQSNIDNNVYNNKVGIITKYMYNVWFSFGINNIHEKLGSGPGQNYDPSLYGINGIFQDVYQTFVQYPTPEYPWYDIAYSAYSVVLCMCSIYLFLYVHTT